MRFKKAMIFCIKQTLTLGLCLTLVALSSFAAFAQSDEQKTVVRVGWFDSPYNLKDASGRRSGYSYEYQRKIAAYTGWSYEYVEGSWSELMDMLLSGEIDLLSDVSYTEERAEKMLYTSYEMGTEEYYIFINRSAVFDFDENVSYFNGKKIGANKGSVQVDAFKRWAKDNHVNAQLTELSCSEPESIAKLVNGELDAFISIDNYVNIDEIIPVVKVGSSDFYFAVTKSRPDAHAYHRAEKAYQCGEESKGASPYCRRSEPPRIH